MIDQYPERWALVTGASSGIGAEFANRLAERGMHLILTARRENLMEELAADLHTRHGTSTKIIPADLTIPEDRSRLVQTIRDENITVELLVNNAGFAIVGEIEKTDPQNVQRMIQLNIAALTDLTYRYLPEMMERQHGAIINIASVAGFQPVAYMGAYAASKAYVLHFTEAIWAEAREKKVTVLGLCPGVTRTDFFAIAGVPSWLKKHRSHSPRQVVKSALKALEKKRQYTVTGWKNYLLSLAVRLATRRMAVTESMKYFRPSPQQNENDDESTTSPEDKTA